MEKHEKYRREQSVPYPLSFKSTGPYGRVMRVLWGKADTRSIEIPRGLLYPYSQRLSSFLSASRLFLAIPAWQSLQKWEFKTISLNALTTEGSSISQKGFL